jgi:hypothetical protein
MKLGWRLGGGSLRDSDRESIHKAPSSIDQRVISSSTT